MKRLVKACLLTTMMSGALGAVAQELSLDTLVTDEELVAIEAMPDSTVSAQLLKERLAKLENIIPLRYHAVTHQFVDYFTYRKASFTKRMLEKHHSFFPLYEQKLKEYGLPDELKYLSLIESGLNPRIISYAGAGGLWQFMPATGREFGMRQDDYIDERFDPLKATDGACRYLKRLYNTFGDWEMALAAYNVGPGNVRRAMRRSGSSSFWGIYNFLPRQTRHYVPQFVAMRYMMAYHQDHGIVAETPDFPMLTDTVHITGYFNLHTFSKLSGVSLDEIYSLNPQLVNTELPSYANRYVLNLPNHHFEFLNDNRRMIWDSASRLPFVATELVAATINDSIVTAGGIKTVGGLVAAEDDSDDPEVIIARKPKKMYHTVRRGETLSRIASRYGVEMYDLKRWNHLRNSKVLKGKRLVIFKEQSKTVKKVVNVVAKNQAKTKYKMRYHRVQSGDTLSTIASRYGIQISRLKKINRLKTNTVRRGQKLLVG